MADRNHARMPRRDLRIAIAAGAIAPLMLGAAYAAVPLYQMFCQVTGFGGTTQRATAAPSVILDQTMTVRFDATISGSLPWTVEPVERTVDVKLGETRVVVYRAVNRSNQTVTGTASFNVTPEAAGQYFNKLECFCFTEQRLEPGQSVEMPVSFFVDPAMLDNRQAAKVGDITLSYTFYPVDKPDAPVKAQRQASVAVGGDVRSEVAAE